MIRKDQEGPVCPVCKRHVIKLVPDGKKKMKCRDCKKKGGKDE